MLVILRRLLVNNRVELLALMDGVAMSSPFLPMCIWESILPLFRELEKLELSPTSWKQIRQMRVPRPGKGVRSVDGAFHASSLRPICIMSSWYRLHATARWRAPW